MLMPDIPIGLKASILTKRLIDGGASRLILTTGVRPIVSMILPNRFAIAPTSNLEISQSRSAGLFTLGFTLGALSAPI
jgi:hypothetical protein